MTPESSIFNWESLKFRRMVGMFGVVVAGLVLFFGVKKNQDQKKKLRAQIVKIQAASAKEEANLKVFEDRLSVKGRSITSALLIALPPTFQADEEYARLIKLGELTNTPVLNYAPSQPAAQADHTQVSLSLSLECRFEDCLRFMNGLHQASRLDANLNLLARGPIWKTTAVSFKIVEEGKLNMGLTGVLYSSPSTEGLPGAAPGSGGPPPSLSEGAPNE